MHASGLFKFGTVAFYGYVPSIYLGTKQDLVHAPNDGIKLRVTV